MQSKTQVRIMAVFRPVLYLFPHTSVFQWKVVVFYVRHTISRIFKKTKQWLNAHKKHCELVGQEGRKERIHINSFKNIKAVFVLELLCYFFLKNMIQCLNVSLNGISYSIATELIDSCLNGRSTACSPDSQLGPFNTNAHSCLWMSSHPVH